MYIMQKQNRFVIPRTELTYPCHTLYGSTIERQGHLAGLSGAPRQDSNLRPSD